MDADRHRDVLTSAAAELTSGGRLSMSDLASATGLSIEEVTSVIEELAGQDLVEAEDGAVVRVTDAGLAEIEAVG